MSNTYCQYIIAVLLLSLVFQFTRQHEIPKRSRRSQPEDINQLFPIEIVADPSKICGMSKIIIPWAQEAHKPMIRRTMENQILSLIEIELCEWSIDAGFDNFMRKFHFESNYTRKLISQIVDQISPANLEKTANTFTETFVHIRGLRKQFTISIQRQCKKSPQLLQENYDPQRIKKKISKIIEIVTEAPNQNRVAVQAPVEKLLLEIGKLYPLAKAVIKHEMYDALKDYLRRVFPNIFKKTDQYQLEGQVQTPSLPSPVPAFHMVTHDVLDVSQVDPRIRADQLIPVEINIERSQVSTAVKFISSWGQFIHTAEAQKEMEKNIRSLLETEICIWMVQSSADHFITKLRWEATYTRDLVQKLVTIKTTFLLNQIVNAFTSTWIYVRELRKRIKTSIISQCKYDQTSLVLNYSPDMFKQKISELGNIALNKNHENEDTLKESITDELVEISRIYPISKIIIKQRMLDVLTNFIKDAFLSGKATNIKISKTPYSAPANNNTPMHYVVQQIQLDTITGFIMPWAQSVRNENHQKRMENHILNILEIQMCKWVLDAAFYRFLTKIHDKNAYTRAVLKKVLKLTSEETLNKIEHAISDTMDYTPLLRMQMGNTMYKQCEHDQSKLRVDNKAEKIKTKISEITTIAINKDKSASKETKKQIQKIIVEITKMYQISRKEIRRQIYDIFRDFVTEKFINAKPQE